MIKKVTKSLTLALLLTLALVAPAAENTYKALATGSEMLPLPPCEWIKGDAVDIAAMKGKKPVVLFFWTLHQDSVNILPVVSSLFNEYKDKVAFVGIGCDSADELKRFIYLDKIEFPVAADSELVALNTFLRRFDRTPAFVVVTREGKIAWRGNPAAARVVIREVVEDKFDIPEAIRREKFSQEITEAMRIQDYEKILSLSAEELKRNPDNIEILALRSGVLCRGLKDKARALREIDGVIARNKGKLPYYELKFKILQVDPEDGAMRDFYRLIATDFADQPMILLEFAELELKKPIEKSKPEFYCNLVRAAYRSNGCKSDAERAMVALSYARMCHLLGRTDLAYEAAKKAVAEKISDSDAKSEQAAKLRQEMLIYVKYYHSLLEISRQL
jgi:peroxiredoxin